MVESSPNASKDIDAFAEFVSERVRVDTANLTADTFEVSPENKFKRPTTPSQALDSLPSNMSDTYRAVYEIYLRKLNAIFHTMPDRRCSAWKAIAKVCKTLNIEMTGPHDSNEDHLAKS